MYGERDKERHPGVAHQHQWTLPDVQHVLRGEALLKLDLVGREAIFVGYYIAAEYNSHAPLQFMGSRRGRQRRYDQRLLGGSHNGRYGE